MTLLPAGLHFIEAVSERFPASANMVAVEGDEGLTLFDAGGSGPENHRTTTAALAALGHAPHDVQAVVLTHAHADHSGGLSLMRTHRPDVRVALHPRAQVMTGSFAAFIDTFDFALIRARYPDAEHPNRARAAALESYLADGDCPFQPFQATEPIAETFAVGDLEFCAVVGEGHAPGHVMFFAPEPRLLIAGDLIGHQLAWHSPKSGGATAYLDALERAAGLSVRTVLPAHGPRIDDGGAQIQRLRDKLLKREDKLLAALTGGARSYAELLLTMIGATSPDDVALFPAVPMLEGHLERLEALGRIRREGGPEAEVLRVYRR